jgi:hypothetical protein
VPPISATAPAAKVLFIIIWRVLPELWRGSPPHPVSKIHK